MSITRIVLLQPPFVLLPALVVVTPAPMLFCAAPWNKGHVTAGTNYGHAAGEHNKGHVAAGDQR